MSRLFAQATTAPNNGASNANDFQPMTRNPQQNPANIQQQQGNLQEPTTQEVLGRSDIKISVPTTNAAQIVEPTPAPQPVAGTNWLAVVVIAVIISSGVGYFISKQHKKRKRRAAKPVTTGPQEVLLVPADESDAPEDAAVAKTTAPTPAKTPPKKKPKKSKSKRKHK